MSVLSGLRVKMRPNPFSITKAEGFNHSYEKLASLMEFRSGVADNLLSNSNVFVDGSRGSGKSMYLRLLSLAVKAQYEKLVRDGAVEGLPEHAQYLGIYLKLAPTIFGPHEYEERPRFRDAFRQLFNVYAIEHLVAGMLEGVTDGAISLTVDQDATLACSLAALALGSVSSVSGLVQLAPLVRAERRAIRQRLNVEPFISDQRSQPEVLWEAAQAVVSVEQFRGMRVHLLIDEYDSLSAFEQRFINSYLRKRDYPLTFKIACKKHRLTLEDSDYRPLNPSGDFDRVELDDDDFGLTGTFQSYLERIANRRLQSAHSGATIRELLSKEAREYRRGAERQFAGFETVTMLSSGIVRTFLELCRDMYSRCELDALGRPRPISAHAQDLVIKEHATSKWNVLARDQSARPELQHLVEQIAGLFAARATSGAESQVIRLEIVDCDRLSSFLRALLEQGLEYEALVQPNRERLQKNRRATSRGYLLHRLLCVHFRLAVSSRWDIEISSEQLERLVLGSVEMVSEVLKEPTKQTSLKPKAQGNLFETRQCPILDALCPAVEPVKGLGFLSCRLPIVGHIRDAQRLIREQIEVATTNDKLKYSVRTAEDYSPMGDIACKVCHAFAQSDFVLAEMSRLSPSVCMEAGLAIARRLPVYILFNSDEQPDVPEPFASLEYLRYAITPKSIKSMVESKLLPFLSDQSGGRGAVRLGPAELPVEPGSGVFIALPTTEYYQETVLPRLKACLEGAGLGPVYSEADGQALQDLQRAALGIARARYCLVDTTLGSPTRALYLGLAQGYRKPFANLIDADSDPTRRVFANARSKAELVYHDSNDLERKIRDFLRGRGESL
jgi:hypothetical protein